MLNIGPPELLLVLVIALIVVGPNKLPELARTIGRGLSEFRKVQDEVKDMVKFDLSADEVTTPTPVPPGPHRTPRPAPAGEGPGGLTPPPSTAASVDEPTTPEAEPVTGADEPSSDNPPERAE